PADGNAAPGGDVLRLLPRPPRPRPGRAPPGPPRGLDRLLPPHLLGGRPDRGRGRPGALPGPPGAGLARRRAERPGPGLPGRPPPAARPVRGRVGRRGERRGAGPPGRAGPTGTPEPLELAGADRQRAGPPLGSDLPPLPVLVQR